MRHAIPKAEKDGMNLVMFVQNRSDFRYGHPNGSRTVALPDNQVACAPDRQNDGVGRFRLAAEPVLIGAPFRHALESGFAKKVR